MPGQLHDKIGLAAEKRGDLGHVENFRGLPDLVEAVDIGKDRNSEILPDALQDPKPLLETRPPEGPEGGSIGLVVGGFEDKGDSELRRDFLQACSHLPGKLLALDNAWPGNEDKGLPAAHLDSADIHFTHGTRHFSFFLYV